MMKRYFLLAVALLLMSARESVAQLGSWYARSATLPAMITTRRDVEKLVTEIITIASPAEPNTGPVTGQMIMEIMPTIGGGRMAEYRVSVAAGLDSMRRALGAGSELRGISIIVDDGHSYWGPGPHSHVSRAAISLRTSGLNLGSDYHVSGFDQERIDRIANRIDDFGKTFATWRDPRAGEIAKMIVQVLAITLLPLALALRDRRSAWLLYPGSAVLFVASYLFPFAHVFNNLVITAGP